jgi:oxygen-independent coproporphyrinogen-3 oxidase
MLMGLRLAEGVDLAAKAARFGLDPAELCDGGKLTFYGRQGLTWHDGTRVGVTPQGMPLLDALLAELVPTALVSA